MLRQLHEVPEEEIIKGYEYTKGQQEIDELKLEAMHTIDMGRFVDDEIDMSLMLCEFAENAFTVMARGSPKAAA